MDKRIGNICQALGFIEKNLCEAIGVEDMAAACGYSLYHFIRLFNQTVHHTPYDYLVRRRLCEAAAMVLSTKRKLIDIAMDYRFQNAETFSRAFNRVFRTLPSQARKTGSLDRRLMLRVRTAAHLHHFQHNISLRPQIKHVQDRVIAGYSYQTPVAVHEVGNIARRISVFFPQNSEWLWVSIFPGKGEAGLPAQMVSCEVAGFSSIPVQLSARRLPAGRIAVFRHRGGFETLNLSRDFIYQTWAANSECRLDLSYEICQFHGLDESGEWKFILPIN